MGARMSINFAKQELDYYHSIMTNTEQHQIELSIDSSLKGLYEFKQPFNLFDDIFKIDVIHGKGIISGVNTRSVLLGVYAYFRLLNCKFLKPGKRNEIIPSRTLESCNVTYIKTYKVRHRAVCIEGSNSLENVLDMIDFLPKNGMNSYFIQFFTPYEFFERWYKHIHNPFLPDEEYTVEDARRMHEKLVEEIKKRDLIYHAVGHGWTMSTIGYDAFGWHFAKIDDLRIDRNSLALVNGTRDFYQHVPLNTQLCYSNPQVKEMMVKTIVEYVERHPEIDILHFWLGDNFNNHCECEACTKSYVSHHYIEILNMLDIQLKAIHSDVKIAFLLYYELLWVEEDEKINNPDRFIMMFAPITRTFTSSYKDIPFDEIPCESDRLPEFKLNDNHFPENIAENIKFLKQWQKVFKGDSFLFDYHLMWDGFKDYPLLDLSRVIYSDMKSIGTLSMNGFISCQLQRVFYPTGHAFYTLVNALSNDLDYDEIKSDYFDSIYTHDSLDIISILEQINDCFDHAYFRGEMPMINTEVASKAKTFNLIAPTLQSRLNDITDNTDPSNTLKCRELSILNNFIEYLKRLSPCVEKKASGEENLQNDPCFEKLNEFVLKNEVVYQDIYDGFFFHHIVKEFLEKKW